MYFIKKITLNGDIYGSSKIVDYIKEKISTALILLENAVRLYIEVEFGQEAAQQAKILDIYNFDQVSEPINDCVLLYRLRDDPHHIHVYRKKSVKIERPGYIYGSTITEEKYFKRTHVFELEECNGIDIALAQKKTVAPQIELVPIGFAGIKIPKQMTIEPMCNLISELKKSPKFQARFALINIAKSLEDEKNDSIISDNYKELKNN
jgi:hypothetical protein